MGGHMLRLNLGSGYNHLPREEGWVNVDCEAMCEPDVVCVLDAEPWPFEDDSVEEALFNHSLEHMGETLAGFRHVIRELYRTSLPNALIQINVPHPRHDDFLNDPTHVRVITPELLGLMDRERCAFFKMNHAANSPIGDFWGVDLVIEKAEQALDPAYEHWRGDAGIAKMIAQYANVVKEYRITLRVRKPS